MTTESPLGQQTQAAGEQSVAATSAPAEAPQATTANGEQATQQQTSTTQQTQETATQQETSEQAAQAPAPEKYEFKAPEGREFDTEVLGQFTEVAKELGMSQESAQKILDKMAPALDTQHTRMVESARKAWVENARNDKEIGGDQFDTNLAVAKNALKTFGSDAFVELLNQSGLGDHPEVIRFAYKVGKTLGEDTVVTGAQSAPEKSIAQKMYPGMNP